MEISEVNKVISEFMGWYEQGTDLFPNAWNDNHGCRKVETEEDWKGLFCKSLDALVPVWEKLRLTTIKYDYKASMFVIFEDFSKSDGKHEIRDHKYTIQEAAARATAKAILELRKE